MSGRKIGRGRWLAVVVSVVLLGALVAPSAAAGGKFPAVNEPGVTANQIRVGGVATVTNDPTGNTLGTAFDGVDAYFAMINSTQKGVYGRKLVLDSKRDDQLGNNKQEVQGLISQDNVFAVLPVAVDLFSGADLLVQNKIPTFGVDIQAEWGSEENKPGPPNFFGQFGSFICFTCAQPSTSIWLAKKLGLTRVGVLALNIPQSKTACEGYVNSLKKYPVAKVVFTDSSLAFGATDYTSQVDGMIKKKVNFVITCIDGNGTVNLAREMKKQGLNAVQALPNAYDHKYIAKYADLLEGSYAFTSFAPFEAKPQSPGMRLYQKWIKQTGGTANEHSLDGWLNADLFVTGLKAAGPNFTRQKLVDSINKITDYTANGLLPGVDWTKAHETPDPCFAVSKITHGKFVPSFGKPGKPFVCLPGSLTKIPTSPEVK